MVPKTKTADRNDKPRKTILWDFDGTLVQFTSYRRAMMDVLDECEPGHDIDQEYIRPFLKDGFPWHRPEEPHPHLSEPEAWWTNLEPLFARAYNGVGFSDRRARELAKKVRKYMINPQRFIMYDDAIPVLSRLKEGGWRNIILSNHMPELPDVVKALNLSRFIEVCITSAVTGYEKPNPQAFRIALSASGYPETVWMIGDNIISDIKGAEAMGIPAILVRRPETDSVKYNAATLFEAEKIINETNYEESCVR